LIGEEGCGKSSLLNWLRQPDAPLPYVEVTGTCSNAFGRTAWIGQTFPAQDEGLTIEAYCFDPVLAEQIDYGYFYQLVSQLGFDPDRLTSQQLMGTLSGGEKLKLQLARTLALEPDCLLLDEPSNDLDLATLDWLSRTLASLPAAILFISHDEAFLAQVANRILHIETIHNHKASRVHLVNLDYETYRSQREAQEVLTVVAGHLGLPVVVKPHQGGSGLGVSYASSADELRSAMVACFAYDERALIERYVAGTELAVSVVDTGEGPRALPPVEVVTDGQYDFDARYNPGRSEYFVPARLDEAVIEKVKTTAVTVHTTLGLGNLSRTDLILDDEGTPWFIDVNVIPGMTETSLLPIAAKAEGSLEELYDALVRNPLVHP